MEFNTVLEKALSERAFQETTRFHWHITPMGIAALWAGKDIPNKPPYEEALKEGLLIGLDLSREPKEFHQVTQGLVIIFKQEE